MERKKISFIINPISGAGKINMLEALIEQSFDNRLFDCELIFTKKAKEATLLASRAREQGADIVVAVGGDGTVNEVARALIGSEVTMAILPVGSGNGLARHLKIPLKLESAMDVIIKGSPTIIDTITLNREVFVNVAGVGFDAHIGWEFSKFGKRGFTSYLKVISREFPFYKAQDFRLRVNGKTLQRKAYLISFANGSQWGNNAYIAPEAKISDGKMDIAILSDFRFWNWPGIAFRLFNKSINRSAYLEVIQSDELLIKQEGIIAHIDGEPIETGHDIHLKVNPLSLKILIPTA